MGRLDVLTLLCVLTTALTMSQDVLSAPKPDAGQLEYRMPTDSVAPVTTFQKILSSQAKRHKDRHEESAKSNYVTDRTEPTGGQYSTSAEIKLRSELRLRRSPSPKYQFKPGAIKNRNTIKCPPNYIRLGNNCYFPEEYEEQFKPRAVEKPYSIKCPKGYKQFGNNCYFPEDYDEQFKPRAVEKLHSVKCPKGYRQFGNNCYFEEQYEEQFKPRAVEKLHSVKCPHGYKQYGNNCYFPEEYEEPFMPRAFTMPREKLHSVKCPKGYKQFGNNCYFYSNKT